MTKEPASMNMSCCRDTEEEDEGCIDIVRCDDEEKSGSGWKTMDASWLGMNKLGG
jgi:hypothetical protein